MVMLRSVLYGLSALGGLTVEHALTVQCNMHTTVQMPLGVHGVWSSPCALHKPPR